MTPLLTVAQVAEYLNVHRNYVSKLIREGELVGIRLGGVWRIEQSTLLAFIDKMRECVGA